MANDLREFMDDHAIPDAVVLGHSMGGKTAMEFAGKHPDRARALVVVDMALRSYTPKHDQIFAMLESVDLQKYAQRQDVEKAMVPFIQNPGVRQFLLTNIVRDGEGNLRWRMNVPALRAAYSELAGSLIPTAPFHGPALFIQGALSSYLVPGDMEEIRKYFPAATMVAIPGARHWVHADAPLLFQQAVIKFLS
jgi:esterase